MDKVDVLVVGAGVVGLAAARALALQGLEVLIVEAAGAIGTGVSSRNSEVIHAGLYYPPGSLKARRCVEGRERLYAYCAERGVAHRRCGKLVVATQPDELHKLDALLERAPRCGVHDLQRLSAAEAMALEPALQCAGAVLSPSTGIVDSHALMLALLGDAEHAGALLALRAPLLAAERGGPGDDSGWRVHTGGDEPFTLHARHIVNAAGLSAQAVARSLAGFPAAAIPQQFLAKGHYFALGGRSPFSRLIYPTPVDGGLGVHLTLDLGGQARFGPDVLWLPAGTAPETLDYSVDPARAAAFEAEIRRYWPALPAAALQPAYSGVRPKLSGPGAPAADFLVSGPAQHGVPGVVHLFGIESPGLTSALALADDVCAAVTGSASKLS
jgi:L-2-hydroxyglutarate oxidase LhgO